MRKPKHRADKARAGGLTTRVESEKEINDFNSLPARIINMHTYEEVTMSESTPALFLSSTVTSNLPDLLAAAPSRQDLIKTLKIDEPAAFSAAAFAKIKTMLGVSDAHKNPVTTILESNDLLTSAVEGYERDLELLKSASADGFAAIADLLPITLSSLNLPRGDGPTSIRSDMIITDLSTSDELQKILLKLNLYHQKDGSEELIFSIPLTTQGSLAWNKFQTHVNDNHHDLFASQFSPLSNVVVRKIKLAAIVIRALMDKTTNGSGDTITSLDIDLKAVKFEKPALWKRLESAYKGVALRKAPSGKTSQGPELEDGDRGDGGMSGSAKDGRRFGKAVRASASARKAATVESGVKKGNIVDTLDLMRDALLLSTQSISASKLASYHKKSFVADLNNTEESVCLSIYNAAELFFSDAFGSKSHIYKLTNLSAFGKLRSAMQETKAQQEAFGPDLVSILEATEILSAAIISFWNYVEEASLKVFTIKTDLVSQFNDVNGRSETLPFVTAFMGLKSREISTMKEAMIGHLKMVDVTAESVTAVSASVRAKAQAEDAEGTSSRYSYSRLARTIESFGLEMSNAAIRASTSLTNVDDTADWVRMDGALASLTDKITTNKGKPLHATECAILKATELVSTDWSVGERKEFAQWMTDPAQVRQMLNLKATEFGASISSSSGRLKNALLKVAVSFEDMSQILEIDRSKFSLDNKISVSIGARGKSGAIAFYDIKRALLAFKNGEQGDGSLMHEWFHALDMVDSGASALSQSSDVGLAAEMSGALLNLRRAMVQGSKEDFTEHLNLLIDCEVFRNQTFKDRMQELEETITSSVEGIGRGLAVSLKESSTKAQQICDQHISILKEWNITTEELFQGLGNQTVALDLSGLESIGLQDFATSISRRFITQPIAKLNIEKRLSKKNIPESAVALFTEAAGEMFVQRETIISLLEKLTRAATRIARTKAALRSSIYKSTQKLNGLRFAFVKLPDCETYVQFVSRFGYLDGVGQTLNVGHAKLATIGQGWPSRMLLDSVIADAAANKSYWSTFEEMGARAFEVYGTGKMEAAGLTNTFLVDPQRSSPTRTGRQVYPSGEHAKSIALAFDALFDIIRRAEKLNLRQ